MPKIQKTQNGMFVYLPKAFTTLLEWKKGDTLAIYPSTNDKGTLVMRKTIDANDQPKKETPQSTTNTQPKINPERFSFIRQQ
jgi:hypothetical protein